MATAITRIRQAMALLLRTLLPGAILAAGWFGYSRLAREVVDKPTPPEKKRVLSTRVQELTEIDYSVVIETHGVVQAHNLVTLTAEIAGVITKVSPSFEAGAYFKAGDFLVEIDPRNYAATLAMSKSRLLAAQSALKLAKLNEDRKLRLVESNAVSQAEVDGASATREQAEADVDLAASQLRQAEVDLQRTEVVAPFDGRVQTKRIGLGQMAGPNTPLGEIFAVDFAEVRLPISGSQRKFLELPEYANDPPVEVVLRDAINDSANLFWNAKIVRTEGVLDENSRDLFAIARIENPFGQGVDCPPLHIGQPVVASIEGIVLQNVVALPRGAVRELNKIILVDRKDQTLLPLTVESIWSSAEHIIVESAAIPTEKWLATTPMVYTPAGTRVEVLPDALSTSAIANSAATNSEPATAQ